MCPRGHDDHVRWVYNQLWGSTRGFSHDLVSSAAAGQVLGWLAEMTLGNKARPLSRLYDVIDLRGSDVCLDTGTVHDSGRQTMPYLAFAWEWAVVQSCPWPAAQHISVLELNACSNIGRAFACR